MTDPQTSRQADSVDRRTARPRRQADRLGPNPWQAISVILSISAIVFAAGGTWYKTSALEARVGNLETQLQTITTKQADQSKDTAVLIQKVDQVNNSVAEIKGQLQRPTNGMMTR